MSDIDQIRKHTFVFMRSYRGNLNWTDNPWQEGNWQPRADIYVGDENIHVYVEVAGLEEDQLRLHYESGQLTIEGERMQPPLPNVASCHQVEIAYGMFRRVVTLPADVDPENIDAQYQSGILEITIPRLPVHHQSIKVNIS